MGLGALETTAFDRFKKPLQKGILITFFEGFALICKVVVRRQQPTGAEK